jgi:glycerol-3-phosphate dehydrogenase (NAD(P)+)
VGAGSFGTALGNILAINKNNNVTLLARSTEVVDQISKFGLNSKYFPHITLNNLLNATCDTEIITSSDLIFLAIPSNSVLHYIKKTKVHIMEDTIIVNLSKGFGETGNTMVEDLKTIVNNPIVSLKGPTFSMELINNMPSAFTCAADKKYFTKVEEVFERTNVHLDFSEDFRGVELLSSLKNIYAIYVGIIDAHFNSANVRFLALTQCFNEMKNLLLFFGGKEETLFKYCGFGDFGLTALNDLSRNRTLGLMIGKGFLSSNADNSVILEGKRSLKILYEKLPNDRLNEYPIISALYALLCDTDNIENVPEFIKRVIGEDI